MSTTKQKLRLIGAFAVLGILALAVGCTGFFQPNSLESVTIQPSSQNLLVNDQQQFTAWGVYEDNSRSQITSGVSWTSSDPSVSISNGGLATAQSVTSAAVTITGSAQGLSGTATVNVIGNVTSISVSPSSATIPVGGTTQAFTFTGSPGPPTYITSSNGGTLTITTSDSFFTCTVGTDTSGNPAEVCSAATGDTTPSYQIQMSYPTPAGGTASSPVVTVNISGETP
jgi:hypothetical protein